MYVQTLFLGSFIIPHPLYQGFKIAEDGLDSSGKWGVDRLIANKGKATVTIPSCLPAGNYLLRYVAWAIPATLVQ